MINIKHTANEWDLYTTSEDLKEGIAKFTPKLNEKFSKLLNAARDRTDNGENPEQVGEGVMTKLGDWISKVGGDEFGANDTEPRWRARSSINRYLGSDI